MANPANKTRKDVVDITPQIRSAFDDICNGTHVYYHPDGQPQSQQAE